ncbi:radial spoke head protein 3 homolog [Watersipora subatra]|uniref:radial spoke head protein 3 homolog n=1 Tax=Watersipora subatra TaxID=2589382 RepID=UPI00355C7FB2
MTAVLPQQKPNPGEGTYTYSSQPRAAPQRKKFRNDTDQAPIDPNGPAPFGNIMWDKRVVRGNTYAQHTLPAAAQPDPIEIQRQQEQRRRMVARKRAKEQLRPRSPDPVEGRKHIDVQTELYLEELSDRVEEADVEIQTDAFLDRPPSPMFIPAKSGVDVDTQIYEGDLFDYDIEVKPILEVLVGKTVEQALLEVMEEEELANLRAQQRAFEELRNAEHVEQQRLEEQERRHREEKERRMKQQREVLKKQKETADKIASRAFAQSYLADLVPSVFGTLADNGYFYDPVERDVEQGFMPWLMDRVCEEIQKSELGRLVVDGMIREIVAARSQAFQALTDRIQNEKLMEQQAKGLAAETPQPAKTE